MIATYGGLFLTYLECRHHERQSASRLEREATVKEGHTRTTLIVSLLIYNYYDNNSVARILVLEVVGEDSEDVVADAGNNAGLYAANQGSTAELINEACTEEAPLVRFMDQDVFHHQPLSLDKV